MKRFKRVAQLHELGMMAKQADQANNYIKYLNERNRALYQNMPDYTKIRYINSDHISFACCNMLIDVMPSLAHGFQLELTGDGDKDKIGEIVSTWLNEEVK